MIVKVKEPQPAEWPMLREGRSCSPTCTSPPTRSRPRALIESGCTAIAYETVTDRAAACRC